MHWLFESSYQVTNSNTSLHTKRAPLQPNALEITWYSPPPSIFHWDQKISKFRLADIKQYTTCVSCLTPTIVPLRSPWRHETTKVCAIRYCGWHAAQMIVTGMAMRTSSTISLLLARDQQANSNSASAMHTRRTWWLFSLINFRD